MKIYLDNCCFNRPYDDQSILSIYLETQAKLKIQENVRDHKINLIWSSMLDFENSENPDQAIQQEISTWRNRASIIIHQNKNIIEKAEQIYSYGISKKDALHISYAIEANCDFFITADKGILKKNHHVKELTIVSLIEYINILEDNNEI